MFRPAAARGVGFRDSRRRGERVAVSRSRVSSSVRIGGLAIVLLALLAMLVGFRPRSERRPATGPDEAELASELRALRGSQERMAQVLARLEALLAERLAAPVPPREPAGTNAEGGLPASASLATLAHEVGDLRAALERESSATRDLIRAPAPEPRESLLELRRRRPDNDWAALEELGERHRLDEDAADRSQYFQTPRDLLEAYGPPTAIHRPKGGGLLFHYRREPEGMPGTSWYFRVQDGFVVEFFVGE